MKKLGKLKLHDVIEISAGEQKSILGGSGSDGWNFMLAPDGNWYSYPGGDAYVYGSAPGYITDMSRLFDTQKNLEIYAEELRTGSYFTSALGIITKSPIALFTGLALRIGSDISFDNANEFQDIILSLSQMGYTDDSAIRYSNTNDVIKVWDIENGQLLYSSDNNY